MISAPTVSEVPVRHSGQVSDNTKNIVLVERVYLLSFKNAAFDTIKVPDKKQPEHQPKDGMSSNGQDKKVPMHEEYVVVGDYAKVLAWFKASGQYHNGWATSKAALPDGTFDLHAISKCSGGAINFSPFMRGMDSPLQKKYSLSELDLDALLRFVKCSVLFLDPSITSIVFRGKKIDISNKIACELVSEGGSLKEHKDMLNGSSLEAIPLEDPA